MSRRQKINARKTIVLTPEELEEMDALSMTGVIRDASDYLKSLTAEGEEGDCEFEDDEFDILDSKPSQS